MSLSIDYETISHTYIIIQNPFTFIIFCYLSIAVLLKKSIYLLGAIVKRDKYILYTPHCWCFDYFSECGGVQFSEGGFVGSVAHLSPHYNSDKQ